ncbi:hypothetical protein F5884DRAFT_456764 [Xylogone sp. PMI_703]|nr:hypothetical protein F5884DRAFT_456764 [Xylogone sp. PMI_703]
MALATSTDNTATAMNDLTPKGLSIGDIQKHRSLSYRLHVFIFDLRHFAEIPKSLARLDQIVDPCYLGEPYFQPDEVKALKELVVDRDKTLETIIQETLNERLDRRNKKRVESGDYRVCAAHDIAPIFEKTFGISPKELAKNKEFLAILNRSGLSLGENDKWEGIPKKSFKKKKR